MPTLTKFAIRNFKGVEHTTIGLNDRTDNPVITLIGLNESGKTTILEALSYFVSSDPLVSSLFKAGKPKSSYTDIIPIDRRSAFNDSVQILAMVELDGSDISEISDLAKTFNFKVDEELLLNPFNVTHTITFVDSVYQSSTHNWGVELFVSLLDVNEFTECSTEDGVQGEFWNAAVEQIERKLPSVAYFPTFLVGIPDKIYLQEHDNETAVNRHYRSIVQSIMEGIDGGLDLGRHVCDRIKVFAARNPVGNWPAQFMSSQERGLINAVFNKVSNSVTKEVIGGWRRVFSKDSTAKEVSVEWSIDTGKLNLPYASFKVSDGESNYDISERSLGFRWFFSFLLFTAFKGKINKPTILIFDEPAANLHAKAQAELLKSFEKIAVNGTKIIYSTHSHHMINPRWLGGAYIVENTALNPDGEFEFSYNRTIVKATKYKEFLSNYPSRSSYFQPVIESLDYVAPEIIGSPPYVVVEGISDYYALTVAQKLSGINLHFRLLPGVGSGASGPLLSLMMGRGERFIVLLDDDEAGRKECSRYKEGWYLPDSTVFTLASVGDKFQKSALEGLLDSETIELVRTHFELAGKPSKKQIGWYMAELASDNNLAGEVLSKSSLDSLVSVLEFLNSKIGLTV